MEEIIYFELDNWFGGRDYPDAEPFISWMRDDLNLTFSNEEWCKENKLCVEAGPIDMSTCFCIAAPRSWVEENCPKLLTDEECGTTFIISYYDKELGKRVDKEKYEHCSYSKFICKPEADGKVYGNLSKWPFREYKEENFGVHWNDYYFHEDEEELEDTD